MSSTYARRRDRFERLFAEHYGTWLVLVASRSRRGVTSVEATGDTLDECDRVGAALWVNSLMIIR
jgi:hypothetical protein